MTATDQTRWTCDRCGVIAITPSHEPGGDRAGLPEGWLRVEVRYGFRGDLCVACAGFVRAALAPVNTTAEDPR